MKKALIGITTGLVALAIFTAGAFANNWMMFNGNDTASQSHSDVDEIIELMQELKDDNISLEDAVAKLEAMNPAGLAKINKELRDEISQLKNTNAQLTTDLNAKQKEIEGKQSEINEKNQAYDKLQQERDGLRSTIDGLNAQIESLQASKGNNEEQIAHLEEQLTIANTTVFELGNKTSGALQQAKEITGGE